MLIDAINATIDFRTSAFETVAVDDLIVYWIVFALLSVAAVVSAIVPTKAPSVVPTDNWYVFAPAAELNVSAEVGVVTNVIPPNA